MIDRENVISNLEMNIRWISDHQAHQFPGWGNVVMAMTDALELLKEQESLKQKMWNALYAEEDKLEKHYVGTDEIDKWIVDYRPFLQRGFEIAIEVIAAHEEGGEVK